MRADHDISLTELRFPRGSALWRWVRWELFIFHDVRDVLATRDPDLVLVVHRGLAQTERWLRTLRDAGLDSRQIGVL